MVKRLTGITREIHRVNGDALRCEFYVGDAARLLESLRDEYAGRVKLVYLDPPFGTGDRFEVRVRVGETEWKKGRGTLALPAYADSLPRSEYLSMMRAVLTGARELMAQDGMIFLHVDYRMHPHLRLLMDEIFGEANFLNDIIWSYQSGGSAVKHFPRKHDVILFYAKSPSYDFHIMDAAEPGSGARANHMKRHVDADGRVYRSIRSGGKIYTYYDDEPVKPSDVWSDVSHLQQKDPQRTGYDTQKPLKLLERIVKCASRPGDIVMDVFAGSGTTMEAAWKNGRRFLGADMNPLSMQATRRRVDGAACEYVCPEADGAPVCEAHMLRGVAYVRVNLEKFTLEEGAIDRPLQALDAVDSWALGYVRDGAFIAYAREARAWAHPALEANLEAPVYEGTLAIRVADILGRNFFYEIS